jgi:sec-independent protein translocase protein TatC
LTFWEHLIELRRRLILALLGWLMGIVVGCVIATPVVKLLQQPLVKALKANGFSTHLTSFTVTEAFDLYLRSALVIGTIVASPWIFYQLWTFISEGLYQHERRLIRWLPASLCLFVLGNIVALHVFEPILNFLLSYNQTLGVDIQPQVSAWLNFAVLLPLCFGVGFQLPLVILVIPIDWVAHWRAAIFTIIVVSAILTPPDPCSMLWLSGCLCSLYGLGLGVKYVSSRKSRSKKAV